MSTPADDIERLRREEKYWLNEYELTGNEICKLAAEAAQRMVARLEAIAKADEKQTKLF